MYHLSNDDCPSLTEVQLLSTYDQYSMQWFVAIWKCSLQKGEILIKSYSCKIENKIIHLKHLKQLEIIANLLVLLLPAWADYVSQQQT